MGGDKRNFKRLADGVTLAPYGEISGGRAQKEDAAVETAEPAPPNPSPQSGDKKKYVMQHPDIPLGRRRRGFAFSCQGSVLLVTNGKTVVDAETADILEKSGWIRKEAL
jgi:hypothetical protein